MGPSSKVSATAPFSGDPRLTTGRKKLVVGINEAARHTIIKISRGNAARSGLKKAAKRDRHMATKPLRAAGERFFGRCMFGAGRCGVIGSGPE